MKLERRKVCTLLSGSAPRGVAYPMIPIRLSEQGLQQSSRVAEQRSLGLWPMHARRGQKHGLLSPEAWTHHHAAGPSCHAWIVLATAPCSCARGSRRQAHRRRRRLVLLLVPSLSSMRPLVPCRRAARARVCGPGRRTEWQASSSSGIARATR